MNNEKAIKFAGLMEEYLNIPSFVCENIEQNLLNDKYKDVIEYIIQRKNEIENKENYKSNQDIIKMYLESQERINKAIEYVNDEIKQEAFHHYLDDEDIQELLKILKGE